MKNNACAHKKFLLDIDKIPASYCMLHANRDEMHVVNEENACSLKGEKYHTKARGKKKLYFLNSICSPSY